MSYLGGMDHDERGMLHDLINVFAQKLNTERRLTADLSRENEALKERLAVLEAVHYGIV
jgi:hypothetical protein